MLKLMVLLRAAVRKRLICLLWRYICIVCRTYTYTYARVQCTNMNISNYPSNEEMSNIQNLAVVGIKMDCS